MKKLFKVLLLTVISISLVGCGSGGTTRKPSGLYRDSDNILESHPDNNMLWKSSSIVLGDSFELKYKLDKDLLELIDPGDGSTWAACKIEFIDGTNIYELSDYDAENGQYCWTWSTYYKYSK